MIRRVIMTAIYNIRDNSLYSKKDNESIYKSISDNKLYGTIKNINKETNRIFIFPPHTKNTSDSKLFTIDSKSFSTHNLCGHIRIGNKEIHITSRFANNKEEDLFLHYLLCKVLDINLFDAGSLSISEDITTDFMMLLFPFYLKRAMSQGLYKQYKRFDRNDANVRGTIDIPRHIRENFPFKGTIAYRTREHSYDNDVTELIRHTIEHMKSTPRGCIILNTNTITQEYVRQITAATQSYRQRDRQQIISRNINPLSHPYYSEYTNLQELCIWILNHKKIKHGSSDKPNNIYGILVDIAWLWEEYLDRIMKEISNIGFTHLSNRRQEGNLYIHKSHDNFFGKKYTGRIIPDFYKIDEFILDAKYKKMDEEVDEKDIYQIISYMHCMGIDKGGFIYPCSNEKEIVKGLELNGHGGKIYKFPLYVPQVQSQQDFQKGMITKENNLIKNIQMISSIHETE